MRPLNGYTGSTCAKVQSLEARQLLSADTVVVKTVGGTATVTVSATITKTTTVTPTFTPMVGTLIGMVFLAGFTPVLGDSAFAALTLRSLTNERGSFLITSHNN